MTFLLKATRAGSQVIGECCCIVLLLFHFVPDSLLVRMLAVIVNMRVRAGLVALARLDPPGETM